MCHHRMYTKLCILVYLSGYQDLVRAKISRGMLPLHKSQPSLTEGPGSGYSYGFGYWTGTYSAGDGMGDFLLRHQDFVKMK